MVELISDTEEQKLLAAQQYEVATATKKIVMDEMSHASRWMMASMLAINSGGLIGSLGQANNLEAASALPVIFFYLGVLTSLAAGWASVRVNQQLLAPHSALLSFWADAMFTGDIDPEKHKELAAQAMRPPTWFRLRTNMPLWSFVMFTLGVFFLGIL